MWENPTEILLLSVWPEQQNTCVYLYFSWVSHCVTVHIRSVTESKFSLLLWFCRYSEKNIMKSSHHCAISTKTLLMWFTTFLYWLDWLTQLSTSIFNYIRLLFVWMKFRMPEDSDLFVYFLISIRTKPEQENLFASMASTSPLKNNKLCV